MTRPSLDHLFVHVADLAASHQFYVERIGLDVLMREPGYLRIGSADGGFFMGMEERPEDQVGSIGVEIVISVPDVDRLARDLAAAGIEISEPAEQPWGARHAWTHDPSGYRISLCSPIRDAV